MFICIKQLSFGTFCKKIFHKNELHFLPEGRALALKKIPNPPLFVAYSKKNPYPALYMPANARIRRLIS